MAHEELEEWRNTGMGTVYVARLSADGTKTEEPVTGKQEFMIAPSDRNSHTRAAKVWSRDPFQNGTFFPVSDNAKAASDALAAKRPAPAPVPEATPDPLDEMRAQMAEQKLLIERLLHQATGSPDPFPGDLPAAPEPERIPDAFEAKANPNVLDEDEMAELLAHPDDDYVARWLATIDSEPVLGNLLGQARSGASSRLRQVQINDRLHQVNEHAPGLPGTTSASGPAGGGDRVPAAGEIDMDRMHVADQFDPSVGVPSRVPVPGTGETTVESIDGSMAMASRPPQGVPAPQPIPAHLAHAAPTN